MLTIFAASALGRLVCVCAFALGIPGYSPDLYFKNRLDLGLTMPGAEKIRAYQNKLSARLGTSNPGAGLAYDNFEITGPEG